MKMDPFILFYHFPKITLLRILKVLHLILKYSSFRNAMEIQQNHKLDPKHKQKYNQPHKYCRDIFLDKNSKIPINIKQISLTQSI